MMLMDRMIKKQKEEEDNLGDVDFFLPFCIRLILRNVSVTINFEFSPILVVEVFLRS